MKQPLPTLAELRTRIDAIDDQLHHLLRERAEIVHTVRRVKGKQAIFIRPGREATMVRALLKRPSGKIPPGLLMSLWRTMIAAFTMQEGRLTAAVTAGKGPQDLWDVSRDYYGNSTPLVPCATAAQAFRQVRDGATELAVLPLPTVADKAPWWRALIKTPELLVFAQIPFDLADAARANWRGNRSGGWVVARLAPEPTGDDHGLLLVWGVAPKQRAALHTALEALKPVALHHDQARSCYLVTVTGLLAPEQKRVRQLSAALEKIGVQHRIAGGYAVPIGK